MLSTTTAPAANSWPTPTGDSSPELTNDCALLAMMVQSQCASQASSKTDVAMDYKKLQELKQQLADAIEKAKEAADHSGFFGFLSNVFGSDVAQIAGAVAAIAAVVATGGAAAPLILMAVSVAMEEGAKVGAKLGLDPKLCMAIAIAGAAVGIASGTGATQSASTIASVARDVKLGAQITEFGATTAGAGLGQVSAHYRADQLNDQADAVGFQAQGDVANMGFDTSLSLLQESLRTEQRETGITSTIIQNDNDTNTQLVHRI